MFIDTYKCLLLFEFHVCHLLMLYWELAIDQKDPIQFQYNSGWIKVCTIKYNTILGLDKYQQFNTIWTPLYCISIQFTLYWSTLADGSPGQPHPNVPLLPHPQPYQQPYQAERDPVHLYTEWCPLHGGLGLGGWHSIALWHGDCARCQDHRPSGGSSMRRPGSEDPHRR